MSTAAFAPVRVEAELEPHLSRWLWLVKWLLAIPHYLVLCALWVAFVVTSVVAFFAILFTGRYPPSIFEFNVGVLRWTWRVTYYAYGALGTDRYPPFTLREDPGYPAHLEIAYPERLSRGLVLVKWWLLVLPHYLIVGLLIGGTTWFAAGHWGVPFGGLIGVLVLVAAVTLAFTGRYPMGLFDFILGLNRWVLRVAAYAGLMTDRYPPFRLDMGGTEPGSTLTIPRPPEGGPLGPAMPPRPDARPSGPRWTGGRITALVIGSILALVSVGLLGGGGFLLWADRTQRDGQGFISTHTRAFATPTYALTMGTVVGRDTGSGWLFLRGPGLAYGSDSSDMLRVRVRTADPPGRVFVGIARTGDVGRYLDGVAHAVVSDLPDPRYRTIPGTARPGAPGDRSFWDESSVGAGTRSILWPIREGSWTVVVMNADGAPGVDVRADAGARIPALPWVAGGLLVGGGIFLVAAAFLIVIPARRAARTPRP